MIWRVVNACILITLTAGGNVYAQQSSETDYQSKLESLKENIRQLQKELRSVKGTRDTLQVELQRSETDISKLLQKIEGIKSELKEQKQQLNNLNSQRSELNEAKKAQEQQLARQINTSYRLGKQSNIKLLLSQQDPAQLTRMRRYHDYFLDARARKIETYLGTIDQLNQVEPAIKKKLIS